MGTTEKRPLMIANGWVQAAGIVLIIGFLIMGILAYYTYSDEPPIPATVKDSHGAVLFTRADIMAGQQVFLSNGLMEYGSIFGHGAYLGPDFTAEYLHRAALSSIDYYGGPNSDKARIQTVQDFKTNRYDETTKTLIFTDAQVHAFEQNVAYYT
ncbi:MAG: hypothetical protein WBD10_00900, partial [Acidobacteriaceae bacterium]